MKKILLSTALIIFAGTALVVGGTGAFFSDTELSTGNILAAGAIDLKIDNESYYNGLISTSTSWALADLTIEKFFDFDDIKPGDYGEDTISLHVDTNDAYLCANVTLTSDDDNGINDPESDDGDVTDGAGNGELGDNVNFMWWADDGDNVLEDNESVISEGPIGALTLNTPHPVTLADSDENIWTGVGGPVAGEETLYIGKAWCFGDISGVPLAQDGVNNLVTPANSTGGISCDGSLLNNVTQSDSLTADVSFTAIQSRNNDGYQCDEPEEEILACDTPTLAYADSVVSSSQGVRKNGTPVLANRSNTASVLGPNQSSGLPSDPAVPAGSFFSLGFKNNGTTPGGEIVVEFTDNVIVDGPGNDLQVWEVTGGVYPDEHVKVEVSQDDVTWFTAAADLTRDAQADLASSTLAWAKYIRLTDITPIGPFEPEADAYDLDAFSALNCGVLEDGEEELELLPPPQPVSLLSESFGVGSTDTTVDEDGWSESGTAEKRAFTTLQNATSTDGGRFLAAVNTGWACHSIDATNRDTLVLSYLWRGDPQAEPADTGIVEYATGGTCAAPIGLTNLATHSLLPQNAWASNSIDLPDTLDGTTFLVRFRVVGGAADEDFRIDGVNLTGIPN